MESLDEQIESILEESYQWVFIPDDTGGFSCHIKEFPGCFAEGETIQKAYNNLYRAAISWLLAVISRGQEVPKPLV